MEETLNKRSQIFLQLRLPGQYLRGLISKVEEEHEFGALLYMKILTLDPVLHETLMKRDILCNVRNNLI